jgi:hypothetical protein
MKGSKYVVPRTARSVQEAQELITFLVNKPLKNMAFNLIATISNKAVGKLGSLKATKKSISSRLHAKAVANIDYLFQNAEIDVMRRDYADRRGIEKIHRLGTLLFDEQTADFIPVMITVKELANPKDSNRIYTVEVVDMAAKETPARSTGVMQSAGLLTAAQNVEQVPIADFSAKIQQIIEKARKET